MKDTEKDIILAIKQGTEGAARQKDKVWNDMQKGLEAAKMKEKRTKNRRNIWKALAAVLLVGAVFLAATPSGRAAVGSLMDLFEPERNIDYQIEGQDENGDYQLHTGSQTATPAPGETAAPSPGGDAVSYVIYVDESRYYVEAVDGTDRIVPLDFPEDLPETYMAISQDTGRTPAEVAEALHVQLEGSYEYVVEPEDVTYPLDAVHVRARTGNEWNSEVVSYYLIDNTVGGTFIIEEHYFLEAEEGHGARFSTMLKEFEIVPVQ